jgi:hypothetical protein
MSSFFTNLAARSLGIVEAVRPRLPVLFEPATLAHETALLGADEVTGISPPSDKLPLKLPVSRETPMSSNASPEAKLLTEKAKPVEARISFPAQDQNDHNRKTKDAVSMVIPESVSVSPEPAKRNKPQVVSESDLSLAKPAINIEANLAAVPSFEAIETAPKPFASETDGNAVVVKTEIIKLVTPAKTVEISSNQRTKESESETRASMSNPGKPVNQPPMVTPPTRSTPEDAAADMFPQTCASSVYVNIGRIEVRAVAPPVSNAQPRIRSEQREKVLSLNDYLKERQNGGRR